MGDIINLRQARKAKARSEAEAKAAQNRITFGRTKAERKLTEARSELEQKRIDAHKRETSGDDA